MKIGIMTYWWSDENYGQILQNYALQRYLSNQGHEPYLIKYFPPKDYRYAWIRRNLKFLKLIIPGKRTEYLRERALVRANKQRSFNEFKRKYLVTTARVYGYKDLIINPPSADVYITGSDQVWNTYSNGEKLTYDQKNQFRAFLLDFGASEVSRVAYAASWGRRSISQEEKDICRTVLKKFCYLSVREKAGVDICKELGYNAKLIADPTLLFAAEDYRELYQETIDREALGDYVFLYYRGSGDIDIDEVYEWAKSKKLKVIFVPYNGFSDKDHRMIYPTIQKWLYFIDNAEYVITDSFHCGLFSILFNKKLGVVKATTQGVGTNTRFDSLFEIMGIGTRYICRGCYSELEKPVQEFERKRIMKYLPNFDELLLGAKIR